MTNNNVRSYEVSIWTLQDSFITVLKPSNLEHKGQIQEAKMSLKDDGTQELTFSLPMYLYEDGIKKENPIWYNVLNGTIIADLRKIKVIFNKGTVDEGVFEFIITKVTERHEDDQLFCDVECEGLAFHELGKIGYKISLNSEDYEEEYGAWAIDPDRSADEPKNNIDYWMNKVLHSMSKWTYSVCMDWTAFDGTLIYGYTDSSGRVNYAWTNKDRTAVKAAISYISLPEDERISLNNRREAAGLRRYDKIYEEPYVSSWAVNTNNNQLTPGAVEPMREKLRLLDIEESNIYNITQTIAETFGVFCKYVYHYDENYHIVGREIVFYNNFVQESTGTIDLTYPYHTNSISREMDATDTISKMFVKPLANDSFSTGYANIMDAAANKSGEDYLLNFAYLYNIGTITEQQYAEVENYELEMKKLNLQMIPLERELVYLRAQLPEKEAQLTVTQQSITLAKDRISAADDLLNSILNGETQVNITAASPEICYPIRTSTKDNEYYIRLTKAGILIDTIRIYTNYASNNSTLSNPVTEYFDPIADEFGNLEKLILTKNEHYAEKYYVTYGYVPDLVQKNVKKTYEIRLNRDLAQEQALTDEIEQMKTDIEEKETEYNELVEQKKVLITQFENMMGPALREGFWQPEDEYTGYGDKYAPDNVMFSFVRATRPEFSDDLFSLGFDDTPFDGEPVNYYSLGVNIEDKHYYPLVNISSLIQNGTLNKANFDKISYIYKDSNAAVGNFSRIWTIGSQCQVIFARNTDDGIIAPYLMLTGAAELSDSELANVVYRNNAAIGIYANGEIDELSSNLAFVALADLPKRQIVYPRFKINSLELQNNDTDLSIMQLERSGNNTSYTQLTNFEDYSVLIRDDAYYITVKPLTMMKSGLTYSGSESLKYRINYAISNSALLIYLDAIQVLKENAFPKVAYDITPSLVNKDFTRVAYKGLDKIAHINDYELKFEHVLGYISEMDLDLDMPVNDTYSIKNYKTKFEDLFSTIVAQTEEMKKNSAVIGIAAGAFTSSGELKAEQVQSVMNRVDLNYAFNQGTLTIDEANGIWGTSDSGVVAFRGGGIFTATQKDADDNWIWNTGILPSGINASLITTGQLDTNLIRIFAGDKVAFQMNGDGLYAYKWDLSNDSYQNQYVVHNKEGLFLHDDTINTSDGGVDRVAISWDGLTLRNKSNNPVFYADANTGDLTLSGTIYASAGSFTGAVTATSLVIQDGTEETPIDQYIQDKVDVDVDIEVGGRNLLRNSGTQKQTASYLAATYTITEAPAVGDEVRIRIWGTLGSDRTAFSAFNSEGYVPIGGFVDQGDGTYLAQAKWRNVYNGHTANDTTLWIFQMPNTGTSTSQISKIKLERGTVATDWTPAPEDTDAAISGVSEVANSGRVFYGSTTPSGQQKGNLWVQGSNGDIKYYDGSNWVTASKYTDNTVANDALSKANAAQTTASGKPSVFIEPSSPNPPTPNKAGDIWFASDDDFKEYIAASNSTWTLASAGLVRGTRLIVDPEAGKIEMSATNTLTIAANHQLSIATNGTLALAGNGGVTIGSGCNMTLTSANITLSGTGKITLSGTGGIDLTSTGSITMSGGNINMTGGTIQLQTTNSSTYVKMNQDYVQIQALSTNSNFIYFGSDNDTQTKISSNTVSAQNGNFTNLTVDTLNVKTFANKQIIVSTTDPGAGSNCIWIQPSSTVSAEYSGAQRSGNTLIHSKGNGTYESVTQNPLVMNSSFITTNNTVICTVHMNIRAVGTTVEAGAIDLRITKGNVTLNILNQAYPTITGSNTYNLTATSGALDYNTYHTLWDTSGTLTLEVINSAQWPSSSPNITRVQEGGTATVIFTDPNTSTSISPCAVYLRS